MPTVALFHAAPIHRRGGRLHGVAQQAAERLALLGRGVVHQQVLARAHGGHDRLCGEPAGDVTACVSTHPVAHHVEPEVRRGEPGVLVHLADAADVRQP
jgi:hypothetical protein